MHVSIFSHRRTISENSRELHETQVEVSILEEADRVAERLQAAGHELNVMIYRDEDGNMRQHQARLRR